MKYLFIVLICSPFFILHRYGNDFEAYPAIILPNGAGLVTKNKDSLITENLILMGLRNKKIKNIPIKEFLHPIPDYNIGHFIERINWLYKKPKKKLNSGILYNFLISKKIIRSETYNQDYEAEYKKWLIKKLKLLNFETNFIIVKKINKTKDLKTNIIKEKTISTEKIYLNDC